MRIEMHTDTIGVTPDGQWKERDGKGWKDIPKPAFIQNSRKKDAEVIDLTMARPLPLRDKPVKMVTVCRVISKQVPDHEAEVLLRNGWHIPSELLDELTRESNGGNTSELQVG